MTWDFQGRNWQVGRQEEEFTAGGWASWELAGRETGRGFTAGGWASWELAGREMGRGI